MKTKGSLVGFIDQRENGMIPFAPDFIKVPIHLLDTVDLSTLFTFDLTVKLVDLAWSRRDRYSGCRIGVRCIDGEVKCDDCPIDTSKKTARAA